jgi:hypothetical protein
MLPCSSPSMLEQSVDNRVEQSVDQSAEQLWSPDGPKSLIQELCTFNGCGENGLKMAIKRNFINNLDFLRGLTLRTTHLKENIVVKADGLTLRGSDLLYALRGYLGITVQQYLFIKHGLKLRYPQLSCIVMKCGGDHLNFYPIELLEIVPQ